MDGVLFDSTLVAQKHISALYPQLTDEMHKELLTGNFHEEIKKLTIPRIIETDEKKKERQLQYATEKAQTKMYGGMKDLLNTLCTKNYILVLNTSAYDRNCIPMLEAAGIKDLFNFLGTGDVDKSKVAKFTMIKEKYNADNNEMLFITDTLGDIREADSAGVPTVAVTWGAHDMSYFTREHHSNLLTIIDSISDLGTFIENKFM